MTYSEAAVARAEALADVLIELVEAGIEILPQTDAERELEKLFVETL